MNINYNKCFKISIELIYQKAIFLKHFKYEKIKNILNNLKDRINQ